MSYYNSNKFLFTNHAIVRARQRIPDLSDKSDLFIECIIRQYLREIDRPEFSDHFHNYYHLYKYENKSLYIVINKQSNVIVTIRKISNEKKLNIYNKLKND